MNKQPPKVIILDASKYNLGRLASKIASLLIGKDTPSYQPHISLKRRIEVVNISKINISGAKLADKKYFRFSGYTGGLKVKSAEDLMKMDPGRLLRVAVLKMLPKNKLQKERIKNLIIK